MNLERTYYFTQIVAVVCLVLSLIYVGLQVNQNTREMRIAAFRDGADSMNELWLMEAQDPELLELIVRAEADFNSLDSIERRRALGYATAWMINANATYEAVLQGVQPDILEGMREGLKRRFSLPLYREMFRERRNLVRDEFRRFLDEIIAETE